MANLVNSVNENYSTNIRGRFVSADTQYQIQLIQLIDFMYKTPE